MDVVFTIVSRNYGAQAATLMESLALAEPAARRVVIATDGPIPALAGRAEVIDAASLDLPFDAMRLYYDALELNTAVKPTAFRALLAQPGVGSVTYLDPDIWVYRPLVEVREGLAKAQLCLTPHLSKPLVGPANPNDHTILQSGVYNLGFMAARNDPQIFALLDWWAEKCRLDCRVDFTAGLFTDQRWMDMAPSFVSDFERLRQPGLNLAYWNLEGRELEQVDGAWRVDGQSLGFFHFSGFDPARPDMLSKHQDRTKVQPGSPLAALLKAYAASLLKNGHQAAAAIPYAYSRFASGRAIIGPMRRRALRAVRAGETLLDALSPQAEAWLDGPDPAAAAPGLADVTRLMDQIWREDPQAKRFDRDTDDGRSAFHRWFEREAPRLGVDAPSLEAGRRLLAAHAGGNRSAVAWRGDPWRGREAGVLGWLSEAGQETPPRACAALLAARADLRQRFEGAPDDLLAWCLGVEAPAGRFDADLLPPELIEALARDGAVLARAGDFADPSASETGLRRRLSLAFGAAPRGRWPRAWVEALQAPFLARVKDQPAPFITLFLDIWTSRTDLQRLFPLATFAQRRRFLRWLIGGGLTEYGVDFQALPARVRDHPWMKLAGLTVRSRPVEVTDEQASGRAEVLVVIEGGEAPDLPAMTALYDAAAGRFRRASGAGLAPPQEVDLVCFLTRPGLVPADAVALSARGVRWRKAVGVWTADDALALTDEDRALGFVGEIWASDRAGAELFRPRKALDPADPLQSALATLVGA